MNVRVLVVSALIVAPLWGGPAPSPEAIVANYCAVARDQADVLNGASMEVRIEASLPKLKKHGRLWALRHISRLGRITYDALRFEGDNTVKNNVIARYLSAETQAQSGRTPSLSVIPENYKFKYKRIEFLDGRQAYVFQVSPRKKRVGLYKGEIWIDSETYLRVQEAGRFVKNPSLFLKKVEFVRKYEIRDGIPVPLQVQSIVSTRLVGPAELTIDFSNFSLADKTNRASLVPGDAAVTPRRASAFNGYLMRTLFLNPPSFEGFDGGASSRWPASREIESYWYPVWLCYPAGMLPDSKVVDAPPHKISIEQTVQMARDFELLVLFTSTPGFQVDVKMAGDDEGRQPQAEGGLRRPARNHRAGKDPARLHGHRLHGTARVRSPDSPTTPTASRSRSSPA